MRSTDPTRMHSSSNRRLLEHEVKTPAQLDTHENHEHREPEEQSLSDQQRAAVVLEAATRRRLFRTVLRTLVPLAARVWSARASGPRPRVSMTRSDASSNRRSMRKPMALRTIAN